MPIIIVIIGILVLLGLIMGLRFNAFLALLLVALGVGLAMGMPFAETVGAMQKGVGDTMRDLVLILALGAMLGGVVADSGAAQVITERLTAAFPDRYIQWALMLTGLIVGIPLFYSVGFVMMIPLIFAVARRTRLPLLYVGIPMIAALSVTHGFLPPHPAPTAISGIYGADIGLVLLYGLIIAIPTIVLAGPIFGRVFRYVQDKANPDLFPLQDTATTKLPPFWLSLVAALSPVVLMGGLAVVQLTLLPENPLYRLFSFIGQPVIALLIAVLLAVFTLGMRGGRTLRQVMDSLAEPVKAIAMILFIIAGGGAFKEVLVGSGISEYVVQSMTGTQLSPLLLAWCIAAALRIALGSATVAAMTAAGIALPLIAQSGANPELLVLATGAGSLTFSQVNDTGFWLFKEFFGLSIGETFRSWTMMETIVSIAGLLGCLVLEAIIR